MKKYDMAQTEVNRFVDYALSFYGPGRVYGMGATKEEITEALEVRLQRYPDTPFCGDSLDRELVRDIIMEKREKFLAQRRGIPSLL